MEVTMVCEEILEEIIVRLPTSAYEKSSKRRKKSASIARPVSTYGDDRHGKYLPKPTRRNVIKDDHYSYQKMRIDHARNRKPLTLRRSLRLSQKIENQECLPECAPGIVTENISGRIQFDSTYDRIDAADDKIISIMDLPHYHSDECEAMVEVLALERQQRDDMPQMKIIPCLEAAEEDRLDCDSSSISTTYNNEHTPKATNNDTGNIPVQSHDRFDATSESNKTVAILDNGPQHKLPISSLTTTEMTSLPWIECFRSDELMGQKREHDIQARPSGVSLTELHQLSLPPWFPYRRA